METVCFVILHFGDSGLTDAAAASILRMEKQEQIRIVIVDNDIEKPEEERRAFAGRYRGRPGVTVLPVRENGGFSYANNLGYRYARERLNASYIILLNNDIRFTQRNFLSLLEESGRKNPCQVMGPDIVCRKTGIHQNPMDVRIRSRKEAEYTVRMNRLALRFYPVVYPAVCWKLERAEKRAVRQSKENEAFYRSIQKDKVLFGACLIFMPDFVRREEAAFVPETHFFYEEYLLAYRCGKCGYTMGYDPAIRVIHENGAGTKAAYRQKRQRLRFRLERTAEACGIYLEVLREDQDAG